MLRPRSRLSAGIQPEDELSGRGRTVLPRTRGLQRHALTLFIGLCASLPVIVAAERALRAGWQPVADRGIIATRAFDVFSSHTPLVGQYSFVSDVTGQLSYSLGPMLYWLLAPAAHIGSPASLVLTMTVVNVGSILGALALARRRGGVWLMFAAAAGTALMCGSLAASNFYDIWNPSTGLFPLTLMIFVCWSLACGEYRLLPLAVLLASFCSQCEDAFLPSSLGLLAVGLVGLGLSRRQPRRQPRRARTAGERQSLRRWMLAALAVFVVCWTPPLIDQVAYNGNLGHVLQAATQRKSALGATVGVRAVIRMVGVRPWWLSRPSSPWVRKLDVRRPVSTRASWSALLILAWLLLAAVLSVRRRRFDVTAGACTALVLCLAIASLATATPTTPKLAGTLGYTLWSATVIGMFVWLIAGWSAVALGGRELLVAVKRMRGAPASAPASRSSLRSRGLGLIAAAALLALLAGVSAASGKPDEHAFQFNAIKSMNAGLGAVPRGHAVLLAARLDGVTTPLRPELTFALRRRGVRALGVGAYFRLGHWYEKHDHPYDYVLWLSAHGQLPITGARVIAQANIRSGVTLHTVTLTIAPTNPHIGV